jgi:hypothetical protein
VDRRDRVAGWRVNSTAAGLPIELLHAPGRSRGHTRTIFTANVLRHRRSQMRSATTAHREKHRGLNPLRSTRKSAGTALGSRRPQSLDYLVM